MKPITYQIYDLVPSDYRCSRCKKLFHKTFGEQLQDIIDYGNIRCPQCKFIGEHEGLYQRKVRIQGNG